MTRRTIQVSVTVDVDDPTTVRAALMDDDVAAGIPGAHEAICDAIVGAIADHAAAPLSEQGIGFVVVEVAEAERARDD